MGDFLGVAKISNIFWVVLEVPNIFFGGGVNGRCEARAYVCRKYHFVQPIPTLRKVWFYSKNQ